MIIKNQSKNLSCSTITFLHRIINEAQVLIVIKINNWFLNVLEKKNNEYRKRVDGFHLYFNKNATFR